MSERRHDPEQAPAQPHNQPASQVRPTRQQLYQRIRETGKEEYILAEMRRLGFWPQDSDTPTLSQTVVNRRAELLKRLRELGREQRLYDDPQQALKALHKARKKQARERREQKRRQRNEARFARAQNWYEKQSREITHLGENISAGLRGRESDGDRLRAQALPVFENSLALATAMGISLNELRFLCYQKEVSSVNHYRRFDILKKSGGRRAISAPMPRLKRAQYWILDNILQRLPAPEAAHGFITGRNIVSNARPHLGKAVVINLDLRDFFPTISYPRVKGVFKNLGYSEHLATVLALLTTEPETTRLQLDGRQWFVQEGRRFLPQGAPTSPALSNIICRRLDRRLRGMAAKLGFTYTRYADDLTFSAPSDGDQHIQRLLWRCKAIVTDEGFVPHPQKTRIMRRHQRQEVTGVVVNEKPSLARAELKRFRALLHQIDRDGPAGKVWGGGQLFSSIDGYANYVAMVNPAKGIALQKTVAHLKRKYGLAVKPGKVLALNKKLLRQTAAAGQPPRNPWWQALPPPAPQRELTQQETQAQKRAARQARKQERAAETAGATRPRSAAVSPESPPHTPAPDGKANTTPIVWIVLAIGIVILAILALGRLG